MVNDQNKQELLRFLVTGCLAVGTDFISYYVLLQWLPVDMAKAISFILGSVVAFVLNKLWTFESDKKLAPAMLNFTTLYSLTFFANVLVNHFVLLWIVDIKLVGFLFATGTSTVLNYLGMKFWVFKPSAT